MTGFRHIWLVVLSLIIAACSASGESLDPVITQGTSPSSVQPGGLQQVRTLPAPDYGADLPIAVDDLLEVDVFQVDELDRTMRVDPSGHLSLALIGMVEAAGKTVPELEADLERSYGAKYLQNPEISVTVKESASRRLTVHGAVAEPGIYPITSTSTLLQVLAQAGGFRNIANQKKLYVFRSAGDRKFVGEFDVTEIRNGKRADPRVYGGDIVVSFSSGTKVAMRNLRETLGIATRVGRLATY